VEVKAGTELSVVVALAANRDGQMKQDAQAPTAVNIF